MGNLTMPFANNHYAGFAPATVDLFRELWGQNETNRKKIPSKNPSSNPEFSF
jgi:hypothetical protein